MCSVRASSGTASVAGAEVDTGVAATCGAQAVNKRTNSSRNLLFVRIAFANIIVLL
jgi:hypothetical protein